MPGDSALGTLAKDKDMSVHLQACLSERDAVQDECDRLQERDRERQKM